MKTYDDFFERLSHSKFRSSFHLRQKDKAYVQEKGMDVIHHHAKDFVEKRLSDTHPIKDGSQTPMKGHPVFVAQHATGTCCRGCLEKWHHIPQETELTPVQQQYIVSVLCEWIEREMKKA